MLRFDAGRPLATISLVVASFGLPYAAKQASDQPSNYTITMKGKQTGQAVLLQKLTPNGGKLVSLTMTIRQGDDRVVVKTQTTYLPDGQVSHAEQRIFPFGKPAVKEVTADFDAKGAKVVTKENGETTETPVARKPTWPVANPSTFWFLNAKPAVGDEVKTFVFNLDTLKWERCVITYEGKTHKGNLVHLEKEGRTVETAYDDDGYPHSIEDSGGVQLERS
jgi:hypothetical protein